VVLLEISISYSQKEYSISKCYTLFEENSIWHDTRLFALPGAARSNEMERIPSDSVNEEIAEWL
jgi:hypothetical protein